MFHLQRCAQHLASKIDVEEAFNAGREAVKAAVSGITDYMIGFKRHMNGSKYTCEYVRIPLSEVANAEKKVPAEWISSSQPSCISTHNFNDSYHWRIINCGIIV